jgi:hypothetical protein
LLDHPGTVYLREAATCSPTWTAGSPACSTRQPRATLDALIAASQDASGAAEALRKVERTLADCHRKVARYRAALDARAMISAVSVQLTARQESI